MINARTRNQARSGPTLFDNRNGVRPTLSENKVPYSLAWDLFAPFLMVDCSVESSIRLAGNGAIFTGIALN